MCVCIYIHIYAYVYIKNFGTIRNRITVEIIVHYKIYRWFLSIRRFRVDKVYVTRLLGYEMHIETCKHNQLETPQH